MSQEKTPRCLSCKHNVKSNSNSPCASKGTQMLNDISTSLGIELSESDRIDELKHLCKILKKYPEDYDFLNPYECKYYMPSYFRMY